jgi:hypothetical protein
MKPKNRPPLENLITRLVKQIQFLPEEQKIIITKDINRNDIYSEAVRQWNSNSKLMCYPFPYSTNDNSQPVCLYSIEVNE